MDVEGGYVLNVFCCDCDVKVRFPRSYQLLLNEYSWMADYHRVTGNSDFCQQRGNNQHVQDFSESGASDKAGFLSGAGIESQDRYR